jgi:superfamily II DNA/RNA helicase
MFAGPLPDLDPVQQEAIDAAMAGKNVFLTGVAGTGKSLVTMVRANERSKATIATARREMGVCELFSSVVALRFVCLVYSARL